jgi:hypothetical protein
MDKACQQVLFTPNNGHHTFCLRSSGIQLPCLSTKNMARDSYTWQFGKILEHIIIMMVKMNSIETMFLGIWKEGKKGKRKKGRKDKKGIESNNEGRTQGRNKRTKEETKEQRKEGRKKRRKDGRKNEKKEGRKEVKKRSILPIF